MKEIWKDIVGYKGLYQISNLGRVRSLPRKWVNTQKILIPQPNKQGYLLFGLNRCGKQKRVQAHRLVAIHFISNPNNLPEVNHIDFNKANNQTNNLEWTSSADNTEHALRYGKVFGVKLNYEIAAKIRERKGTSSQRELAIEFGVGPDQISRILNYKVWTNI
jgi:hypothetical protein